MSTKIFCPNCGTENEKLDAFCSSCGTALNEIQITESLTTPNTIQQQVTSEPKFEVGLETKTTPSIIRRKNNLYIGFSIASLIFPALVGSLFTWLDGKIIFSDWMIDYLYGHYQDQYYIILICSIVYLLLLITGIVFGSISLKKGLKELSILGLIANIILIIVVTFRAFIMFMVYFVFD